MVLDRDLANFDFPREKMDGLDALLVARGELICDLAKIAEISPSLAVLDVLRRSVESGTALTQKLANLRRALGDEHQRLNFLAPYEMTLDQNVAHDIAGDSG